MNSQGIDWLFNITSLIDEGPDEWMRTLLKLKSSLDYTPTFPVLKAEEIYWTLLHFEENSFQNAV